MEVAFKDIFATKETGRSNNCNTKPSPLHRRCVVQDIYVWIRVSLGMAGVTVEKNPNKSNLADRVVKFRVVEPQNKTIWSITA